MTTLDYATVRERVQDGDIAFFNGNTLLAKAIKRVTCSEISHIGLLFWEGPMLMLHEAVGDGYRAIRMSAKVATCTASVVVARHRQVDSVAKRAAIRRESHYLLAVEYNWYSLLQIYFRIRLGLGRKPRFDKELICSEAVAKAYSKAGIEFQSLNLKGGFVSPHDIFADLFITEIGRIKPEGFDHD